jgi:hypothetical protein
MNYHWITLTSRNIDCSTITAEEFISSMFSDFLEAQEKYNDLYTPEWVRNKIDDFTKYIEWIKAKATKYAEKKWKTDAKRNAYINSTVNKAKKDYDLNNRYTDIDFFDLNVNPGEMGISGNCCISYENLTPKALLCCFNEIKNNEYFKKAKGWMLTYEAQNNSYRCSFRPKIKLILDDETAMKMKKATDDLTNSVNEFYENCNYFGD